MLWPLFCLTIIQAPFIGISYNKIREFVSLKAPVVRSTRKTKNRMEK